MTTGQAMHLYVKDAYPAENSFLKFLPGCLLVAYPQTPEIQTQQLYLLTGGSTLIELHMTDGRAVSIQSTMQGAYQFLNYAFIQWCNQSGKAPADCDFYNPANSCWFPNEEC